MINSNEYTRAILLRDPKEYFLCTYLDKAVTSNGSFVVLARCHPAKTWREHTLRHWPVHRVDDELTARRHNPHRRLKRLRMEHQLLSTFNFIGNIEGIQMDAKALYWKRFWGLRQLWKIWIGTLWQQVDICLSQRLISLAQQKRTRFVDQPSAEVLSQN